MGFLTPWFLGGLALLAVPLLIHLTRRDRATPVPFPSLMFVRRVPTPSTARRRLRAVERVQRHRQVLARRGHEVAHRGVERHQPHAVALLARQPEERRRQHLGVVQLGGPPGAREVHRLRHVQEDGDAGVRVGLELLHVQPVAARVQPPVHAPRVVARQVRAVLGEVGAGTERRRAVQAAQEAVHHRARDQVQPPDAGEHRGIQERGGAGGARGSGGSGHGYIRAEGTGTACSRRSTSWSTVTRSDCAWKLRITRCRSTGRTSARTSSKLTW